MQETTALESRIGAPTAAMGAPGADEARCVSWEDVGRLNLMRTQVVSRLKASLGLPGCDAHQLLLEGERELGVLDRCLDVALFGFPRI